MPNTADIAAQAGVRVKQLEWHRVGTQEIAYALFGGSYAITECAGMSKPYKLERCSFDGPVSTYWDTRNEAKAAVQANFEARILAAIEPQAVAATKDVRTGELVARITDYLTNGGLFNPEMMPQGPARDLLIDCRAVLTSPVTASDERAVAAQPARKIVTHHVFPPIPDRRNDWCAHYEGEEEAGGYGYGHTEAEAVQDFIDNYQADHDARLAGDIKNTESDATADLRRVRRILTNSELHETTRVVDAIDAVDAALAAAPKAQPVQGCASEKAAGALVSRLLDAANQAGEQGISGSWGDLLREAAANIGANGPTVTPEMVGAAYDVFAGKMLMHEEDRALIERMLFAALSVSHPVQGWQTPEGYALVPIQPTEAMLNAGDGWSTSKSIWSEMLAAAPLPAGPSSKEGQ